MEFTKEMLNDPQALLLLGIPIAKGLVSAIAIFFIGRWVAQLIIKLAKKAMHRAKLDETLITFLSNVAYGLLLAIIIISALGQLGVDTTSAAAPCAAPASAPTPTAPSMASTGAADAAIAIAR